MEKRFTQATIEKTDKGLVAVASTAVEDRHGEVVEVSGWDLKNYKKNPVMLWGHQHEIPAIGSAKNVKLEGDGKNARLTFQPVFHEITEFAKATKALVDQGIINSFSVGFMPLEMDGNRYTKQELLEISLVNVPANPEARLMAAKSLGEQGYSTDTLRAMGLADEDPEIQEIKIAMRLLKEQNVELQEQLEDVVKGLKHLNPPVDKREALQTRLTLAKVIARATDKILEAKGRPDIALVMSRVNKRAIDKLIVDAKRDLQNGKNIRTS